MSFIQTASGQNFNLLVPEVNDFRIEDIAQALSNICRFTGHLPQFYSVAQHSVLCSQLVAPEFALEALLHDAHEAYVGDIAAPLKALLPDYRRIEDTVELAVRYWAGLMPSMSREVHEADIRMLATERRDLLGDNGTSWPILEGVEPDSRKIKPWVPDVAYGMFMGRFKELTK